MQIEAEAIAPLFIFLYEMNKSLHEKAINLYKT
jgi:hypothetical protein